MIATFLRLISGKLLGVKKVRARYSAYAALQQDAPRQQCRRTRAGSGGDWGSDPILDRILAEAVGTRRAFGHVHEDQHEGADDRDQAPEYVPARPVGIV